MKKIFPFLILLGAFPLSFACSSKLTTPASPSPTSTPVPPTPTHSPTITNTPSITFSFTPTGSYTNTPTITFTPTTTPTGTLAPGSTSTPSNDIVYAGQPFALEDIYVMNSDGSNKRNLTSLSTPHKECVPRWSPDKSKIAYFLCGASDSSQIYVINANGTSNNYLGVEGGSLCWSPGGTIICYVAPTTPTTICLIPAAGGVPVSVVPGTDPSWSPSGTTIVFDGTGPSGTQIGTVHPDGSSPATLTSGLTASTNPSYSPDGTKILYIYSGNVMTMNPDGSNPVPLTSYGTGGVYTPVWSPDGSKIAYVYDSGSGFNVYVMSNSGSNVTLISSNAANGTAVHWSPDSQFVIFDDSTWTIILAKADGIAFSLLTSGGSNYTGDWAPLY